MIEMAYTLLLIQTTERLRRYEEITQYASEPEIADIMAYVGGEDQSEVAKLKAALAYTAAALGRELAIRAPVLTDDSASDGDNSK